MFNLMAYFLQVKSGFDHPFLGVRHYPDSIEDKQESVDSNGVRTSRPQWAGKMPALPKHFELPKMVNSLGDR